MTKLYKYRTWSDKNHRKAIINNEIFFCSPGRLNDPFDCKIPLNFLLGERSQNFQLALESLRRLRPHLSESQLIELTSKRIDEIYNDPDRFLRHSKKTFIEKWERDAGIYALSSLPNSIVMWSHYGDGHNGFVIGYDLDKLNALAEFSTNLLFKLCKVNYVIDFPNFNPFAMDDESMIIKPLSIKSNQWAYENEYRLILINGTNKSLQLPPGIITDIIFGIKMKSSTRSKIISIIDKKDKKITISESLLSKTQFEIIFNKIDI